MSNLWSNNSDNRHKTQNSNVREKLTFLCVNMLELGLLKVSTVCLEVTKYFELLGKSKSGKKKDVYDSDKSIISIGL